MVGHRLLLHRPVNQENDWGQLFQAASLSLQTVFPPYKKRLLCYDGNGASSIWTLHENRRKRRERTTGYYRIVCLNRGNEVHLSRLTDDLEENSLTRLEDPFSLEW